MISKMVCQVKKYQLRFWFAVNLSLGSLRETGIEMEICVQVIYLEAASGDNTCERVKNAKKKLNWDEVATEASADPTGIYRARTILPNWPELTQRGYINQSMDTGSSLET